MRSTHAQAEMDAERKQLMMPAANAQPGPEQCLLPCRAGGRIWIRRCRHTRYCPCPSGKLAYVSMVVLSAVDSNSPVCQRRVNWPGAGEAARLSSGARLLVPVRLRLPFWPFHIGLPCVPCGHVALAPGTQQNHITLPSQFGKRPSGTLACTSGLGTGCTSCRR